jgi:Uma2 family endonuclease
MQSNQAPPSFQPPRYTYNDYKNWTEDWELIYGYAFSLLPAANRIHQATIIKFSMLIGNALDKKDSDCNVINSLDWIVDNETVVRPDSMIYCGNITTDFLTFPPTLILEVASQSTWMKDRNIKLKLYEANNVKYYLLANPDKKILESFELKDGVYQPKEDGYNYELTADCSIEIDPEKLW